MALPKDKQDELWRLGQEQGTERVMKALLERHYPLKSKEMLEFSAKQHPDAVFEAVLVRMLEDGKFGAVPAKPPSGQERPPVEQVAKPADEQQAPIPSKAPGIFEQLAEQEEAESLGKARLGEAIVGGVVKAYKKVVREPLKKLAIPEETLERGRANQAINVDDIKTMLTTKSVPERLQNQLIRGDHYELYEQLDRSKRIEVIQLAQEFGQKLNRETISNSTALLNALVSRGLMPTIDEMGEDFILEYIEAMPTGLKREAGERAIARMFTDPRSSRVRRGKESIRVARAQKALAKGEAGAMATVFAEETFKIFFTFGVEPVEIVKDPEKGLLILAGHAGGRFVVAPLMSKGVAALIAKSPLAKRILTLDLAKAFNQWLRFKKVKASPELVTEFLLNMGQPDIAKHITIEGVAADSPAARYFLRGMSRRFSQMPTEDATRLAEQFIKPIRRKGIFKVLVPRTISELDFGVSPENRAFSAIVPFAGKPTVPAAPPAGPVGEAVFGIQENLPMIFDGIPDSVAGVPPGGIIAAGAPVGITERPLALPAAGEGEFVPPELAGLRRPAIERPEFFPPVVIPRPTAIPLNVTTGIEGMSFRQFPRRPAVKLLPAPGEPSPLLLAINDPSTQVRTGLTPDLVNMLREHGLTDQQIMGLVGPQTLLPGGVRPTEAAVAPVTPTEEVIPPTPTADVIDWANEDVKASLSAKFLSHKAIANDVYRELIRLDANFNFFGDILFVDAGKTHIFKPGTMEQAIYINPKQVENVAKKVSQQKNLSKTEALRLTYADLLAHEIGHVKTGITVTRDDIGRIISKRTYEKDAIEAAQEAVEKITEEAAPPIPLPEGAPPVEVTVEPTPVEVEKPVRVIPKRSKVKKDKIQLLPDKDRVLAELDAAIKKASDVEIEYPEGTEFTVVTVDGIQDRIADKPPSTEKLAFKMDGGTIEVFNTKDALTQVRKLISSLPKTMDAPGVTRVPAAARGGISPRREQLGELVKGAPKGYFTDGRIIVKGTPPKSAKFDPSGREIQPEILTDMLKRPTDTADLQYYALVAEEDIGVSSEPIVAFRKEQTPWAIFRTGNKFVAYSQYKVNIIKKRYPDAKYGIDTSISMLVAYDDGQPVGAVMGMKVLGNEVPAMDAPPAYTMALEAGLIEEVADNAKDIAELRALGYSDKQIADVSGLDARQLIADQIPAEEVVIADDGAVSRVGGAKEPRPVTSTTEELTAENVKAQEQIRKEQEEAGFLGIRRPRLKSEAKRDFFQDAHQITGNDEFADSFYQSRGDLALWERTKHRFKSVTRDIEDLVFAEANRYLRRAATSGKYPANVGSSIAQFERRNRTHYQTARSHGMQLARRDAYGLWGELDVDQQERLENLIAVQSIKNRLSRGLPEIEDVTMQEARQMFTASFKKADSQTRAAFKRYDVFQKAFSYQHLVDRGKLNPEHVYHFYAPHQRLDYLWGSQASGFVLPEPAKPRYRGYLQRTFGSTRSFAVGLDVIQQQWAVVRADNLYEDFMLEDLTALDATSRQAITQKVGGARAKEIFKDLAKGDIFPLDKAKYVVTQFEPGRYHFPALIADPELLRQAAFDAAIDVNRLLSLSPDEQEVMLDRYFEEVGPRGGDAVRRAIVVGRYKPLYVVPEEVFWRLRGMRAKNLFVPMLRNMQRMSSYWKTLTLTWAGIPYHLFQVFFIDTPMQVLTAPGSLKSLPPAYRIMKNLHKLSVDSSALGSRIQETFDLAVEEDIFGSGFLREYMMVKPKWTDVRTWTGALQRWGALRESWNRVAMLDYQWHERYKKGKPFEAIHFEKKTLGYTPKQTAGYIASNFTVDFEATPDWYRSIFRGFLFPFITGAHKGTLNVAGLTARMPFKRPLRFFGLILAPLLAVHVWNNTGWRKEYRDRMGWAGGRWYTTILERWDDNNDGVYDRLLIWSPRTHIDEAGEWIGIDTVLQVLHRLRRKHTLGTLSERDKKDAVQEILTGIAGAAPNKLNELSNPILQFIQGVAANRDPFTKKSIMPPEVRDTPAQNRYIAEYLVKKMMTPIEQLARTQKGGGIEQRGPGTWPSWFRSIAGAVQKGPLNVFRGMGFKVVDLHNIERSEALDAMSDLEKRRLSIKRELQNEFIYNGDIRLPESIFDFYANVARQWDALEQGNPPTDNVGKILKKARDRGIDFTEEIQGSSRQAGSIRNVLLAPRTWMLKTRHAVQVGASNTRLTGTPTPMPTMQNLTKAEKKEFDELYNVLGDVWLKQNLQRTPLGIRAELLEELLTIYGVDVNQLLDELEKQ